MTFRLKWFCNKYSNFETRSKEYELCLSKQIFKDNQIFRKIVKQTWIKKGLKII